MSRCFPFPPPGYVRKNRPEELDLLKEAKSKEKKHNKERKKDKEKEKDGGDEKHRDKKDRKEKHKDKKEKHRETKEKEDRGNKDKEKSSISEESTVPQNVERSEKKLSPLGNSKDIGNFPNEGKCSALLQDQNGGKTSQSSLLPTHVSEESKFVLELEIRNGTSRGSQLPERVDKRDQNVIMNSSEEKGDNINNRVDEKMHPQVLKNEMAQNFMPIVKSKGEGIHRPLHEENGRKLEDKEKYKETISIKRGEKQKEKSKESHGKEKNKEKKKNKKERDDKAKLKTENKKSDQDKLKDDGRNDLGDCADNQSTDVLKGANNISVNEGNIKKRKDMGTNGFLHESDIMPNKMQRSAPHQLTENGTKSEPFRTPAKSSNDKPAVPNSVHIDSKDQLINGMFKARKPSLPKPNPPAAAMVIDPIPEASKLPQGDFNDLKKTATVLKMVDPIAEASRRSPHPDSKYLAGILTVPKNMSNWAEYDDQNWLFSQKVPSKPKVESFGEDVCVWSEAVHIESADFCALPYVIPY